jgi:hypothetical protein
MIPPENFYYFTITIYTLPKKKQRRAQQYFLEKALLCTKEAMPNCFNYHTKLLNILKHYFI